MSVIGFLALNNQNRKKKIGLGVTVTSATGLQI